MPTLDERIETAAGAMYENGFYGSPPVTWAKLGPERRKLWLDLARFCLRVAFPEIANTHAVLPLEATEEMKLAAYVEDQKSENNEAYFSEQWEAAVAAYLAGKDRPT